MVLVRPTDMIVGRNAKSGQIFDPGASGPCCGGA